MHAALHTASLAARALRKGLDADSARAAPPRTSASLTGTDGVALYDGEGTLLAPDPADDPLWTPSTLAVCDHTAADAITGQRRVLARDQTPPWWPNPCSTTRAR